MINYIDITLTIPCPTIDFVLCYLIVGSLVTAIDSIWYNFRDEITVPYMAAVYGVMVLLFPAAVYFRIKRMMGR